MDGYSALAMAIVTLAFGETLWMDPLVTTATGEAPPPFYVIASAVFTSAAFVLGVASIHARAAAVFRRPTTPGGGGHVRLQRFLVTTATGASMAAVVARCLALARVNQTSSAAACTDV
jgi:hypothetical protein